MTLIHTFTPHRVSADTVAALTSAPDFSLGAPPPPPTVEEMVDTLRHWFRHSAVPAALGRSFERILDSVPVGFRLAPVFYDPVTPRQKRPGVINVSSRTLRHEFAQSVVEPFYMHLARHERDALEALGIDGHGLACMRRGARPQAVGGRVFGVNIDHIVEQHGAGAWCLRQMRDPDRPEHEDRIFRVNHFGNIILLPQQIHNLKNKLNGLQFSERGGIRHSQWVLMLVPERNEQFSGFVAPPQPKGHPLYGLALQGPSRLVPPPRRRLG